MPNSRGPIDDQSKASGSPSGAEPIASSGSDKGITSADPSSAAEALKDSEWELSFEIDKSIRYHVRRRAHYEWLHRITMLGIILLGSAAFAGIKDGTEWLAGAAAVLGALDLVYSWSHKARDHQQLAYRFADLEIQLVQLKDRTLDVIAELTARRKRIEVDEPPTYYALEADCWNESCRAKSDDDEYEKLHIPFLCRRMRNWLRFEGMEFKKVKISRR